MQKENPDRPLRRGSLLRGVRAVVFDAVGTLIHPEPAAAVVYADVGRRFGSRLTARETGPRFAAAFAREEAIDQALGLRTSEAREVLRWQRIVTEVLEDVLSPGECFQELFEHFERPGSWRCDPDAAVTVAQLAELGYTLGIASNYDCRLRTVVTGLPALQPVKHLMISSELGWRKPAPEFFAAVAGGVALAPEQIAFVGDDPANDYEGARQAGFLAILLDREGRSRTTGARRINALKDLLGESIPPTAEP
jgi:putative hydrolase of the HAD superfamily